MSAPHLYVHMPFCAHRCGYCDFVTARHGDHDAYVDALLAELALERGLLADDVETIFLGGGTPTFTEPRALQRLLAALPPAREFTTEANPETVTPELAALLHAHGVNRVSLGAQSFQPDLLRVLERRAGADDVRRAVATLREVGFANVSLDLIYGIPGQSRAQLEDDLGQALALAPEHISAYELEAKPGTRFTHAHGAELERQAEAMESYFELVVATLTAAGYRWYETANFCRDELRAQHNLGYWLGHDYLGIGIGAVSTIGSLRWRNRPSLREYLALTPPPRELEELTPDVRETERLMLSLRLDQPVPVQGLDPAGLQRVQTLGLARVEGGEVALTDRGRFLGDAVTATLLA